MNGYPRSHTTRSGDCLSSIAQQHGFRDWRTIYDAPENEALRATRPNPNTLLSGDTITIPDRLDREESCTTARRHHFVAKLSVTRLRLRLRTHEPVWVELQIANREPIRRAVPAEAELATEIAPDEPTGVLYVWLGVQPTSLAERPADAVFDLVLGALPTAARQEGAGARLVNLGYASRTDAHGGVTEASIRAYQRHAGMVESGTTDDATCSRLEADHDS